MLIFSYIFINFFEFTSWFSRRKSRESTTQTICSKNSGLLDLSPAASFVNCRRQWQGDLFFNWVTDRRFSTLLIVTIGEISPKVFVLTSGWCQSPLLQKSSTFLMVYHRHWPSYNQNSIPLVLSLLKSIENFLSFKIS